MRRRRYAERERRIVENSCWGYIAKGAKFLTIWYNTFVMIPHILRVKKLFAKHNVKFTYLFGSRATGKGTIAASDYDFAVFFGAGTPKSRFAIRLTLLHALQEIMAPAAIDLVVLDDTRSAVLRDEIVRTGQLLYVHDHAAHIEFEFRAMHEYEDFAPFLAAYNKVYMATV